VQPRQPTTPMKETSMSDNPPKQKYWRTAIAEATHDGMVIRGCDVLKDSGVAQ
jgi:hypothetical protein